MRTGIGLGLLVALGVANPVFAQNSDSGPQDALLRGLELALQNKGNQALEAFREAQSAGLPANKMRAVKGLAYLSLGRTAKARAIIPKNARWAVYRAMAVGSGPGGVGRARSILGKTIMGDEAGAGTHFLAALAFSRAGQSEAAHKQLKLAAKKSGHALGHQWAPDPGVGLGQAVLHALKGQVPDDEARVRVSETLLRFGRRGAVLSFTEPLPEAPKWRVRALAVRAKALAAVGPLYAVDAVQAWLEAAPKSPEARLCECEERLADEDWSGAKRALAVIVRWPKVHRARMQRARAKIALATGHKKEALRHARAAVRAAPKAVVGRALLAEALVVNGEFNRAGEIAEQLLKKKTTALNAFALLAKVRAGQARTRKLQALKMRAQGLQTALTRPKVIVAEVEKVLGAVRDAEAGLGVTGLIALRDQDPRLALPVDIALARLGSRGVARQARDRILTACTPHLARLLAHRGTWDQGQVSVSVYGKAVKVSAAFSAADPYRCRGGPVTVGRGARLKRAH